MQAPVLVRVLLTMIAVQCFMSTRTGGPRSAWTMSRDCIGSTRRRFARAKPSEWENLNDAGGEPSSSGESGLFPLVSNFPLDCHGRVPASKKAARTLLPVSLNKVCRQLGDVKVVANSRSSRHHLAASVLLIVFIQNLNSMIIVTEAQGTAMNSIMNKLQ